jgi:hypothetical protein
MSPVSLKPSEFSEGGEFPRGTLTISNARFGVHEFKDRDGNPVKSSYGEGTVAPSMAAILELTNEDTGTVFEDRVYTVGQPSRYTVSTDGLSMEGEKLNANCNFAKLLSALIEIGYPEDKFTGNIRESLVGLTAHWDQKAMPNGEQSKQIWPVQVYTFPWDNGAPSTNGTQPAPAPTPAPVDDLKAVAAQFVNEMLASNPDDATRQSLAARVYTSSSLNAETKVALSNYIYSPECNADLMAIGITVEGERYCQS